MCPGPIVLDRYGAGQLQGPITLGSAGGYSFTILLQASRLGTNRAGRLYTVNVRASDNSGNPGSASAVVKVPHDQRHWIIASELAGIRHLSWPRSVVPQFRLRRQKSRPLASTRAAFAPSHVISMLLLPLLPHSPDRPHDAALCKSVSGFRWSRK